MKKLIAVLVLAVIVGVACLLWWMGPYGEGYLPVWIEKGKPLV